jgi:hypothetical protein
MAAAGGGDAYVAKLAGLLGGWSGPTEPQLEALAALLKAHSAESTALVAWLREDAAADAWLSRLTGPEAHRPQARLPWPYDTFAALHMQVLGALARGAPGDAYDHQEKLALAFLHAMEEEEFTWSQTVMVALFIDLRRLAVSADRALRAAGQKTHRCDQAADKLRQGFSKVSNDKGKDLSVSKKWSALHLINQIFKLLFSINQLSVGLTNLQRWVDSPLCPNHTQPLERRGFPKSQVVTYQYYSGRLALYEDDFETASRCLQWAFAHCHASATRNKQAILRFLVPVQLLIGRLPSSKLLQKHHLAEEYEDIVGAVRDGNVQQFEIAMAEQYERYARAANAASQYRCHCQRSRRRCCTRPPFLRRRPCPRCPDSLCLALCTGTLIGSSATVYILCSRSCVRSSSATSSRRSTCLLLLLRTSSS